MRLCILGAGAIGGTIGARLALAGEQVTLVMRSEAAREAIRRRGLELIEPDGTSRIVRTVAAVATPAEAGAQDAVFLGVKAHQIPALTPGIRDLFDAETAVISLQNGVPWWYFQGLEGSHAGLRLASLDPQGAIAATIEPARIIGGVVYIAAEAPSPGVIRQSANRRLVLGAIQKQAPRHFAAIVASLRAAGFEIVESDDIRRDIWVKAWGNLCFNSLGALTHSTIGGLAEDAGIRAVMVAMMAESQAIMTALGVVMPMGLEERLKVARAVAGHKPSMLQDVEAGRPLEIDALLGAVSELGRITRVPTPRIDAVYACVKRLERVMAAERVAFPPTPLGE
jgi:2-dehydropantoate 2-reductase